MPSLTAVQNSNASFQPPYVPVAVITGGTSGIGAAMAQALAKQLKGRVRIILIGRNKAAANAILASMHPASPETPEAGYEFIACDLTLMAKIRDMTDQLRARVPKVNFLVHCAAITDLSGRVDTEEGLDVKLASRYYSRFALTYGLLSPLQRAADAGEKVSVQTVMGAGLGKGEILMDDLGLKKTYTAMKAMREATGYNDLMVAVRHFSHFFTFSRVFNPPQAFAQRYPQIAFGHIHPGAVKTANIQFQNPFAKLALFLLYPLVWYFFVEADVCAEYMIYALLDAKPGLVNRRNRTADDIGLKAFPMTEGAADAVWKHSVEETRVVS
jgi:NAD(P)-dependent dehydrogenase (short-subunit alcohol dehydrogenase family)